MPAARARGRGDADLTTAPAPRSDAYTGLLAISLVAMLVGTVLLVLDWKSFPEGNPSIPSVSSGAPAPAGGAAPGATPPAAGGTAR